MSNGRISSEIQNLLKELPMIESYKISKRNNGDIHEKNIKLS